MQAALASVAQLVGVSSSKVKGGGFHSTSGHMPGLRVQSPIRMCARGNRSMFLTLSLSFSLSPFPSPQKQ